MARKPEMLRPDLPPRAPEKDMFTCGNSHHHLDTDGENITFDGICAELLGHLHTRLAAEHVRVLHGLRVANARLAAENISLGKERVLEANKMWIPQHIVKPSNPHAPEALEKSESRPFFANRPVSDRPDFAHPEAGSTDPLGEVQEEECAKNNEVSVQTSPALQEHAGDMHAPIGTAGTSEWFSNPPVVQGMNGLEEKTQPAMHGCTRLSEDPSRKVTRQSTQTSVSSMVKEVESRFKQRVLKASEDMFLDDISSDEDRAATSESAWLALPSQIVSHAWFELWVAMLILTNTIYLGFEVDDLMRSRRSSPSVVLEVVGMMYGILFVIEWCLRIAGYGWKFVFGPHWSWHLLDTVIVIGTVLQIVTNQVMKSQRQGDPMMDSRMSSLRLIRILRTMRMLRILRVARLLKVIRPFRLLIYQIIGTLRCVCWALLLFLIIVYMFALFFAQAVAHSEKAVLEPAIQKHWSSLSIIMSTLFMSVTGGVDWENAISALSYLDDFKEFYRMLFIVYISFVMFAVLNTVTGVFCQKAIESAKHDHETMIREQLMEKNMYMKKTRDLFSEIDGDASRSISYKQFSKRMADEQVIAYFAVMGLEAGDAWDLFKLLDTDKSAEIDLDEFVDGCMKLRGTAKTIDVAKLSYDNKLMRSKLATFMRDTEDMLQQLVYVNTGSPFCRDSLHVQHGAGNISSAHLASSLASHL